jgi:ribosome-interacting GTPase 1
VLTNAEPAIGAYPFTTHMPQPGMMPWQDVQVQLVDTPPITGDYIEGYLPGMVRGADAALLVVDLSTDDGPEQAQEVIDRLAQTKTFLVAQLPDDDEQFDVGYTRTFIVATKLDAPGAADRLELVGELFGGQFEILAVSIEREATVEALRDRVYAFLDVIRVYTKEPGKRADMDRPYTCAAGSTVLDAARLVHKDFAENLKFARCWGTGVFDGQTIGRDHVLHDRDVLELHL